MEQGVRVLQLTFIGGGKYDCWLSEDTGVAEERLVMPDSNDEVTVLVFQTALGRHVVALAMLASYRVVDGNTHQEEAGR